MRGLGGCCRITGALLLLALTATQATAADAPPEAAAVCLSCHGAGHRPADPRVPVLGGQSQAYLAGALRAYREGRRLGGEEGLIDAMIEQAMRLDAEAIEPVAAYFSSLGLMQ